MEEKSIILEEDMEAIYENLGNSPPLIVRASSFPPIAGTTGGGFPPLKGISFNDETAEDSNIPDDEKIQMHMHLTHELDELYDFDTDMGDVAPPRAALPVEKEPVKSMVEIEAEYAFQRGEVETKKSIIRAAFWRNHSLVDHILILYCFTV